MHGFSLKKIYMEIDNRAQVTGKHPQRQPRYRGERILGARLPCRGCSKLIIWFRAHILRDFLTTSEPITNQVIKL